MKQATKKEVVGATRKLARGYKLNNLDHRYDTCSLCMLFYEKDKPREERCSRNCPNSVFTDNTFGVEFNGNCGCMQRNVIYEFLSWHGRRSDGFSSDSEELNLMNLSMFWTRVGNYLQKQKDEEVENLGESDRIKAHIIKIADELNKK